MCIRDRPKRYAIWGKLVARRRDQVAYSIVDAKVRGLYMPSVYPAIEADSIREQLLFRVRVGEKLRRRGVRAAQVARVAAVAAAQCARRTFQHEHARAALARGEGGAESGVAAADDDDVVACAGVTHAAANA